MTRTEPRYYRFERSAHWAVCARDGLRPHGHGLIVSGGEGWQPLDVAAEDRAPLALSAGSGVAWLRRSGVLMEAQGETVRELGFLGPVEGTAVHLACGPEHIWVAYAGTLRLYHRRYLQLLAEIPCEPVLALAIDSSGARCLTSAGDGGAIWRHFDDTGREDRPAVEVSNDLDPLDGAVAPCSEQLLILSKRRVLIYDPCKYCWRTEIDLACLCCHFDPCVMDVDCEGVIHLYDPAKGTLWSFAGGARIAERKTPPGIGSGRIAAGAVFAFAGSAGVFRLSDAEALGNSLSAQRDAALLTPTLTSPPGTGRGWQRARILADLPPGTALSVRVAYSDDDALAERISALFNRPDLPPTERLGAVEGLLPWDDAHGGDLTTADDPLGEGSYDLPLDGIEATYLWVLLRLQVPPTSRTPLLRGLIIGYPAQSWIDDLPAIYQRDIRSAAELRRFLSALASVFDDLGVSIAELPDRLDPTHANDQWLSFLLTWLGVPMPADLPSVRKRALLQEMPLLLDRRGTVWALDRALEIVTGLPVRVQDHAAGPLPQILGEGTARLGCTSLLVRQHRRGLVVGKKAQLGQIALGKVIPNTAELVAQRTGTLEIGIAGRALDNEATRAAVQAVLDHFLPAACRVALIPVPAPRHRLSGRLNSDSRTADSADGTLGHSLILRRTALATSRRSGLRLGRSARIT
ncbi:phage tail protein [Ruegeria sp. MALMAid1280]|uniref:phage tail protein n=1 Tax=Ruegeria sp. MALMAid1280 TaxID=3411634 RepID=UPI003BA1DAE6